MAEAITIFTVTPVAHPRDPVVIGGRHRGPNLLSGPTLLERARTDSSTVKLKRSTRVL
jgi:hypothetical protein